MFGQISQPGFRQAGQGVIRADNEGHGVWPVGKHVEARGHAVAQRDEREFGVAFAHLLVSGIRFHELQVDGNLGIFPLEPTQPVG